MAVILGLSWICAVNGAGNRSPTERAGLPPQIDVQAGHEVHAGSHGLTIAARRGLVNA
jgi:hypothetical protein